MQIKELLDTIIPVPVRQALSERYLAYALSTITARSLPDVRDGLKPVHRRVLYAMRELGLVPQRPHKKAARVVGDVVGKFHPHGEVAIYDALVRLAQDFSTRYPLVDGQGNFGNIDGDSAAAMRYTEARLTPIAMALLSGLEEEAAPWRTTYDGEHEEPVILPGPFPNLLANGSTGIAVGMATNVPPHNVQEIGEALLLLLEKPQASIASLLQCLPAPDFPTGGVLVEDASVLEKIYATGRGSLRVRATWSVEPLQHGNWQIVVTEIPYQVQKAKLIEQIAGLLEEKKVLLLADLQDESAADLRIVFTPRTRTVSPEHLMESLFSTSDLQTRFHVNLNVLDSEGRPRVMNLVQLLNAYLDHRKRTLRAQAQFQKTQAERRLEVVRGLLIAYLNLDEVIEIIRREEEPKPPLMTRFNLTDIQAEAILNTRLRHLRRLEEEGLLKEDQELLAKLEALNALLTEDRVLLKTLKTEIREMQKTFGAKSLWGPRRTQLGVIPQIERVEEVVEREPLTVLLSEKGWIRAVGGHLNPEELEKIKYKEGDSSDQILATQTFEKIVLCASNGRVYTLPTDKLPRGRGFGDPVRMSLELSAQDTILSLATSDTRILWLSSDGRGFIGAETSAQTRQGRQVMTPTAGSQVIAGLPLIGDAVALLGSNGRLIILSVADLPVLSKGRGSTLQKYKTGTLKSALSFTLAQGLPWLVDGTLRFLSPLKPWLSHPGGMGRLAPVGEMP